MNTPYDPDEDYRSVMRLVQPHTPLTQQKGVIIPPMLYLPVRVDQAGRPAVEVRTRDDGSRALLAYTALDRLAAQCGSNQSWVLVAIDSLAEIKDAQHFDLVAFDPKIAPHLVRNGALA